MIFASAPPIAGREFPKILCWDDVDPAPLIQLECLPDTNPSEFLAAMLRHWNLQTAEIRLGATIPELGEHLHDDQITAGYFRFGTASIEVVHPGHPRPRGNQWDISSLSWPNPYIKISPEEVLKSIEKIPLTTPTDVQNATVTCVKKSIALVTDFLSSVSTLSSTQWLEVARLLRAHSHPATDAIVDLITSTSDKRKTVEGIYLQFLTDPTQSAAVRAAGAVMGYPDVLPPFDQFIKKLGDSVGKPIDITHSLKWLSDWDHEIPGIVAPSDMPKVHEFRLKLAQSTACNEFIQMPTHPERALKLASLLTSEASSLSTMPSIDDFGKGIRKIYPGFQISLIQRLEWIAGWEAVRPGTTSSEDRRSIDTRLTTELTRILGKSDPGVLEVLHCIVNLGTPTHEIQAKLKQLLTPPKKSKPTSPEAIGIVIRQWFNSPRFALMTPDQIVALARPLAVTDDAPHCLVYQDFMNISHRFLEVNTSFDELTASTFGTPETMKWINQLDTCFAANDDVPITFISALHTREYAIPFSTRLEWYQRLATALGPKKIPRVHWDALLHDVIHQLDDVVLDIANPTVTNWAQPHFELNPRLLKALITTVNIFFPGKKSSDLEIKLLLLEVNHSLCIKDSAEIGAPSEKLSFKMTPIELIKKTKDIHTTAALIAAARLWSTLFSEHLCKASLPTMDLAVTLKQF